MISLLFLIHQIKRTRPEYLSILIYQVFESSITGVDATVTRIKIRRIPPGSFPVESS